MEAGGRLHPRERFDRQEVHGRQQPLPDEPAIREGRGDHRWGTYRQIEAAGGQVRRGEKGTTVLFFSDRTKKPVKDEQGKLVKDPDGKTVYEEEQHRFPMCKQYTVFNVEQADGLELKPRAARSAPEWRTHQEADLVIRASGTTVQHAAGDRAFYCLDEDKVVLPELNQFSTRNGYYQTALHECGHSTGHPERMDRDTLREGIDKGFGSPEYAREELRAEISAMMTGERVGVGHNPQRGAAYVENWVKVLEDDPHEIRRAARDAQQMSDYLLGRARELTAKIRSKSGRRNSPGSILTPGVRRSVTRPSKPRSNPPNSRSGTQVRAADGPTR